MTEISKVLQVKRLLRPQEFGKPWSVNSFEENTPYARKGKLAFEAGKKKKIGQNPTQTAPAAPFFIFTRWIIQVDGQ